jgi:hypothetical protein
MPYAIKATWYTLDREPAVAEQRLTEACQRLLNALLDEPAVADIVPLAHSYDAAPGFTVWATFMAARARVLLNN